ncbi:MAG: hypothetical protein GC165_14185 [Armatimonadetes bacterium]|nr:hypothetical protein [Armatimonadota bacterium]MBS1725776.1 DinB family protein [Armatimonadota bacterium]
MEVKPIAFNALKSACGIFLKDLEALPEEAFCKSFGGKARTVADIVHEVNMVNDHIGLTIRGEELFEWPDGWITAPPELNSKQAVVDSFKKSSEKILATVEGYSEAEMLEPIQSDGSETNRFERCRFMALHLWYHSGQLNFIQTLLGDDGWHW